MSDSDHRQGLLPSIVCEQVERLLNRALDYAPGTQHQLTALKGQVLGLQLYPPDIRLSILFEPSRILVRPHLEENPTTLIRGSAVAVFRHLSRGSSTGEWIASDIEIVGDTELLQTLSRLMQNNDLDLEEVLAEHLGDVVAHQVTRGTRSLFGFVKDTGRALLGQALAPDVSDARQRVSPEEAQQFYEGVDEARSHYDRLEARFTLMESALQNASPSKPS